MSNKDKGQYQARPVYWNNIRFSSISDLARFCGTTPQRLRYYLNTGKIYSGKTAVTYDE